ncbi:MAG: DNA repair protein RecO [Patescibacteria group bacterium]|jgi:DNA repair protein RecO (recombination protein O)
MTETYNTKAIVLYATPWREADRLYTLYTERFGKLTVLAQSARKIQSKLAGVLEPYAEIDVFIIRGKNIARLGGAEVVQRFGNINMDKQRIAGTEFCIELLRRLITNEDQADHYLYQLLYSVLVWLNEQPVQRLVLYSFFIKLINILGYQANVVTNNQELKKIITWLEQAEFIEAQRLRLNNQQWQSIVHILQYWLEQHGIRHIHSAEFLVY